MLFNSYIFIFAFFPIVLLVYFRLGQANQQQLAIAWLCLASLFFYGWWNPIYLALIISSIIVNYTMGRALAVQHRSIAQRKAQLTMGIVFNLGLLGYFKYANFFVDNINLLLSQESNFERIILPLAISFYTFQQIAYLVDTYKNDINEHKFLHYCLFVTFFPQLIAGPIVHHKQVMPQFQRSGFCRFNPGMVALGLTLFFLGLFKKVVIADNLALYATPVYSAAQAGIGLNFVEAWSGAVSYTLQLYFDFSGYSDMAIGIASCFGITLPVNFNSPHKSLSIIEFWQRWHITLSTFLRDYLYISMGGNRKGPARRYINLMITMLLGGLWHGAGWNYFLWGGLHGLYLVINNIWRDVTVTWSINNKFSVSLWRGLSWFLTFIAVVIGLVFFRGESLSASLDMINSMLCFNVDELRRRTYYHGAPQLLWLIIVMALVVYFPNTQQLAGLASKRHERDEKNGTQVKQCFAWQPNYRWASMIAFAACIALFFVNEESEFLYFQF